MSTNNQEAGKWLRTGGLKGEPVEVLQELPDGGMTVRKRSGEVVYLPKLFLDLAKVRNRGKD